MLKHASQCANNWPSASRPVAVFMGLPGFDSIDL